ncbi:MAG: hydrogenase expression/formation protein HypE [Desulfobacteraceae bacterium]|nr:MAG: hydrogenase expression/formation protein HypE [Desulfobacteraceae bacterium]
MEKSKILLDHGGGGRLSRDLISAMMLPAFDNPILARMDDGAQLEIDGRRMAFSTDGYVVDPIFFPGGDIGSLAVYGTVNDIAMCGAVPLYLSAGLIIEEGFPAADLEKIIKSMGLAAQTAGVSVVTGDTKVVPRGAADKIFIHTSGIGLIPEGVHVGAHLARPGDRIILSGAIADHGMTILAQRQSLGFDGPLTSDSAPLNHMVQAMLAASKEIHVLRDPTRGGVGTALNEIALSSTIGIRIIEKRIPIQKSVRALCEILGFDPLYVANEGKLLAFAPPDQAAAVLAAIRTHPLGRDAVVIGEVVDDHPGIVVLETLIGGERIIDMPLGEQLPRIC